MQSMKKYIPLSAGSIDGTDTVPHDRAIYRAMNCTYIPPKDAEKFSKYALFIARLPHSVTEEKLCKKFSSIGKIKTCKIIRDIVTGMSKGYGFVEYVRKSDAVSAYHEMMGFQFHGRPILVDWKISSSLPGWIPRRLGGGWGGKKESGQLRFGCRARNWHKPILIPPQTSSKSFSTEKDNSSYSRRERNNHNILTYLCKMNDFSDLISEEKNKYNVKCPFCDSLILLPNCGSFLKEDQNLPAITQKKEAIATEKEEIHDWWIVKDMFMFENIGFTHSLGTWKYLSCADCERGPIGYHDLSTKLNYLALIRVKHEA